MNTILHQLMSKRLEDEELQSEARPTSDASAERIRSDNTEEHHKKIHRAGGVLCVGNVAISIPVACVR